MIAEEDKLSDKVYTTNLMNYQRVVMAIPYRNIFNHSTVILSVAAYDDRSYHSDFDGMEDGTYGRVSQRIMLSFSILFQPIIAYQISIDEKWL